MWYSLGNRRISSLILLSYSALVVLNQYTWINYATISNLISQIYHVSSFDVGLLDIIFPLTYIPLAIPVGIMIDKFGYRSAVIFGGLLMTLFSFFRLANFDFLFIFLGQLGVAIAQPFLLNSSAKLAKTEFSGEMSTLAIGISTLSIFIGIATGTLIPSIFVTNFSSLVTMTIYSSLVMVVFSIIFIASSILKGNSSNIKEKNLMAIKELKTLISNKNLASLYWLLLIEMGIFIGILTWIDNILGYLNFSEFQIGLIALSLIIGGIVGSFFVPLISVKIGSRRLIVMTALIISLPAVILYAIISNFPLILISNFVLGFFMLGAFPIIIDWTSELSGKVLAGSSISILYLFGNIGGTVIPLVMIPLTSFSPNHSFLTTFLVLDALTLFMVYTISKVRDVGENQVEYTSIKRRAFLQKNKNIKHDKRT
ncbi:MFS transporter [Candidatus Acidianus copahuensis]|uniref:MFS transporter n=1 Tax=Candidatus Acidianus copahuensis TaxID=1160895 RepID=UPI00135F1AA1|nr:MFS transporter [Candidatus Acidianus copahuensis]